MTNSLGLRIMRHVASLSLIYLLRLTNFCLISSSSSTTTVLVATYICVFSSSSMHVVVDAESHQEHQQQRQQQQQQQPLSVGKLRSLGEVALSERRYADAESLYLRAIKIEPDNALNHHKLYTVRKRKGATSLGDALGDISRAVDLDPGRYDYRVQKAALLVHLGRCDEASGEYVHAQRLANDDEVKRNAAIEGARDSGECARELNAASEARRDGRWEDAARRFDAVLGRTLDAPDLLFLKADAEYRGGDYYGAVSDAGRILKNYPQHLEAYQLRGGAYARLNEMDMAVKHYREGLKLDPEHKGEFVFFLRFAAGRDDGRAMCDPTFM